MLGQLEMHHDRVRTVFTGLLQRMFKDRNAPLFDASHTEEFPALGPEFIFIDKLLRQKLAR